MPLVKTSDRDSFGYRLIQILKKLNQGDKLDPKALAEEFNVNLRAIQRDLNERFAFLQLEMTNGLLVIALAVTAGAYGASFLGFYYLFGKSNIGWAIFAAVFLALCWCVQCGKSTKRGLSRKTEVCLNER